MKVQIMEGHLCTQLLGSSSPIHGVFTSVRLSSVESPPTNTLEICQSEPHGYRRRGRVRQIPKREKKMHYGVKRGSGNPFNMDGLETQYKGVGGNHL